MNKDVDLKLYGLIGYPVEHSLSPAMHNAAFRELGINARYETLPVEKGKLYNKFLEFKDEGYQGLNITFPYKQEVIRRGLIDEISQEAKHIGAVNTIDLKNGRTYGYNTDGIGFVRAFEEKFGKGSLSGKSMTIVGCGGAGSAVAVQVALSGVNEFLLVDINVVNRENLKTKILEVNKQSTVHSFGPHDKPSKSPLGYKDLFMVREEAKKTTILVEASPVGMNSDDPPSILNNCVEKKHIVCDLVYHPAETPLLKFAKEKGAQYMNGFGMLLYQGVEAFEIWTEEKAPVVVMKKALEEKVYGGGR